MGLYQGGLPKAEIHILEGEPLDLGWERTGVQTGVVGKIFGTFALGRMLRDDRPLDRNVPTSEKFKRIGVLGDMAAERDPLGRYVGGIRGL